MRRNQQSLGRHLVEDANYLYRFDGQCRVIAGGHDLDSRRYPSISFDTISVHASGFNIGLQRTASAMDDIQYAFREM